jgi:hypothetical protein
MRVTEKVCECVCKCEREGKSRGKKTMLSRKRLEWRPSQRLVSLNGTRFYSVDMACLILHLAYASMLTEMLEYRDVYTVHITRSQIKYTGPAQAKIVH